MLGDIPAVRSRGFWVPLLLVCILCLPTLIHTGAYLTMDTPAPKEGMEPAPHAGSPLTGGILFVVLDGVREDLMLDEAYMPVLNRERMDGATLKIQTGPLTMTGACVREMATGVTSRPSEGLNNFHPTHPGTPDGWTLASTHDEDGDGQPDNRVAIVGDYVWRDLYPDRSLIPFSKHFYGHADFYQGDEEAFDVLEGWVTDTPPEGKPANVIIAHLSGTDHVGHRYGTVGSEDYKEKLNWIDDRLSRIFDLLPADWTIVVTSDHGATPDGRHGSPDDDMREVAAVMWGPNIAKGVTVTGLNQRDLATLPSTLLALPLPHAIDGRIPLDAFAVSQSQKDEIEQWNWDAAIGRNDWLDEEGWPSVEGLSREKIEWDRLPDEELGVRSSDIYLAGIAAISILGILAARHWRMGGDLKRIMSHSSVWIVVGFISAGLSYSRGSIEWVATYYLVGRLSTLTLSVLTLWAYANPDRFQRGSENRLDPRIGLVWLGICALVIMFPDTRFSMVNWVLWAACLFALWNRKERDQSEVVAWSALTILMIPALFFIHHRIIGFNLPRELIFETMSETVQSTVFGVLFIVAAAWLAHGLHERRFFSTRMGVVMFCYGLLPILMYPKSNMVDWAVLIALMGAAIFGIIDVLRSGVDSNRLLEFTIIGWLTIAWGGWAGAVTLAVIAITERLLDGPWGELLERRQHPVAEHARIAILVLLPLALWFLIWASLGQVEGVFYPRELDAGKIILRGGYIGDRASPSNEWVGFMGASPAFLLIFLLWRAFHRSGWPLHLLGGMLLIRHSLLWLHLSMAANLPRFVFKATWDSIFSILLVLMLAPFVIEQWLAAAPESEAEAIEVESHSG